MSIVDTAGKPLDRKMTYRLTVPASAPVNEYWPATAYDRETHALIKATPRSSRASNNSDVRKNADGSVVFTREQIGTRHVMLGVRTLVNPEDPADVKQVHALQDAIKVEQPGGPGKFEVPNWDPASHAYTINNVTAKKDADGSVKVQFGGAAGDAPNVLPIAPGWNYMVRLYRPRVEVLDGKWKMPEAVLVS
jgi:hypothetical protein